MWEITEKVKDYFINPRNPGEIEDPDGKAEVESPACGDLMRLTFRVDSEERIIEARFKAFGCTASIAAASALTEMITGSTLNDAARITNEDIAAYLGGLPSHKMHCAVLGQEVLEKAIGWYRCAGVLSDKSA